MVSHASNPTAEHLHDDLFRIYFSSRDARNRSHIGWIEIDITSPFRVLNISQEPVLSPGEPGTFDDSGVSIACITSVEERKLLYYVGWNLGVTVPWRNSIGLAVQTGDLPVFHKYSLAPLLDRNTHDPFSLSYPYVLRDEGMFRMWYGSNLSWGARTEDMFHVIKYAESSDGIDWKREGLVVVALNHPHEHAISRPFVRKEQELYKMWYSYRGNSYRIGYAESLDGKIWTRKDSHAGIDVSGSGWDSDMIEYPFLFSHNGNQYLLYNGNGFGKTGFGLAVQEP